MSILETIFGFVRAILRAGPRWPWRTWRYAGRSRSSGEASSGPGSGGETGSSGSCSAASARTGVRISSW